MRSLYFLCAVFALAACDKQEYISLDQRIKDSEVATTFANKMAVCMVNALSDKAKAYLGGGTPLPPITSEQKQVRALMGEFQPLPGQLTDEQKIWVKAVNACGGIPHVDRVSESSMTAYVDQAFGLTLSNDPIYKKAATVRRATIAALQKQEDEIEATRVKEEADKEAWMLK